MDYIRVITYCIPMEFLLDIHDAQWNQLSHELEENLSKHDNGTTPNIYSVGTVGVHSALFVLDVDERG